MLRTIPQTRDTSLIYRLAAIAVFVALTWVGAKLRVEIGAVPFTLQTLFVVLAGMVLGARDGAISQLTYVGLIVAGLPLDARGLGTGVFAGPTWGYLIGFIPAAFVTGLLTERGQDRLWQRWLAGLVGMLLVFFLGVIGYKLNLGVDWMTAINDGFVKFIPEAVGKGLLAAALAEGGRAALLRLTSS